MFAEVQSNGIKSLDLERKVLVTFFLKRKKGSRFWNHIFLKHHFWDLVERETTPISLSQKSQIVAGHIVWKIVCMCECEYMYMCTYGHTHLHMCIKYICTYIYMYETRMELTV